MKILFKQIAVILMVALLIDQPAFATLPNEEVLDFFDKNGIYYYNPEGSNDLCGSSSTTLTGSDTAEKIWNFFIKNGFNDVVAAAILGNAMAETGMEPTRASRASHWGLFQWSQGRQAILYQKLRDAGLGQYLSTEYWPAGASKKIPQNDFDRILQIELEHTLSEKEFNWQEEIKKQNTPEAAAEVFLTLFERAVGGSEEILYYTPYIGIKYQGTKRRREYAREYYDKYSGKGVAGTSSGAEEGDNLSIIGDSITVGTTNELLRVFPKLKKEDISAQNGRSWGTGITIAQASKLKQTVVFALGTNSPGLSNNQVLAALEAIGTDKNIILVTNFSATDAHIYDSNNEKFLDYAKKNSNIVVADWHSAVKNDASKYMADHVHPNAEGGKLFAQTIYDAVNNNVNNNGCSVSGEFLSLVKAYAWPEYHKAPFTNRMPEYANAVTKSLSEGRYVGGSINGVPGIDCGGFVTVLAQNSGLAPDYNDTMGATETQEAWVKAHNWTLLNGSPSTIIDTSILQPGDVAFTNGHTFIYVGEIAGFNSKIASASYGQSTARAPMAGHEDLLTGRGGAVRWWRNPSFSSGSGTTLKTNLKNIVYDKK